MVLYVGVKKKHIWVLMLLCIFFLYLLAVAFTSDGIATVAAVTVAVSPSMKRIIRSTDAS